MAKRTEHPELQHPSTKRARRVDQQTPMSLLVSAAEDQEPVKGITTVAHWFRSKDLRIHDNVALHHASSCASEPKKPFFGFYVFCPEEYSWHGTSPARVDFILQTLQLMKNELQDLDIPMVFLHAESRKEVPQTVTDFLRANDVSHLFANFEYEVDEIRRDQKVLELAQDTYLSFHHDQCIVEPGSMTTGSGGPMKVFSPYHRAWLKTVKESPELLDTVISPSRNKSALKKLKDCSGDVPPVPENKQFKSNDECDRIRSLWPAGHDAGIARMRAFIQEKIEDYASTRSNPAKDSSSRMSTYLSSGAVSVREALSQVRDYNGSADFSSGGASAGVAAWVREVVFRELYRQLTVAIPHNSMNLPQNLKFESVMWEEDEEGWYKWCEGKTGVPFIDAGMRQINSEAYMHNRLRMNVSSYLYCNLLIDYRRGERYFAEHLVDWDLSNNTQGWEPSYTVFNPVSQAEKNDPSGDYIRKWVPELNDVQGKAIFSPHNRLSEGEFEKLGYPRPHVDWNETKARAMERFKSNMADADP